MVPQLDLRSRAATDSARSASGGLADGRPPAPSLLPIYLAHATTHLYIGLFPAVLFMVRETFSAGYGTLGAVFTAAMLAWSVSWRLPFAAAAVLRGGILASIVYLAGFFGQWWGGHLGGRRHAEMLHAVLLGATALLLAGTFFAVE